MSDSYSVKAILSAQDKGFSSAMKAAMNSANNLKQTLTGGFGFGVLMGAGQKAFDAITTGIGDVVSGLNSSSAAWKTFQGNMEMNGKSADEIKNIKNELQSFAEQTIYSSSDMASTFAQLDAVGTKSTLELVKGFGGLAAAAENPTQAMKTLSQQATQMAAKPKVQWEDFKLMIEQTPAGIAAVAKSMGKTTQDLIKDVQDGKVATEDFFAAISEVGTNDAFTKLATEYKTVDQAMDGLTETMANKLQPAFDVVSQVGIDAISGLVDKVGELDGQKIADKLTSGMEKIKPYWDEVKEVASEVGAAFGDAFSAIGKSLADLNGAFGSTESVSNFGDVIGTAGDALKTFAGFLEDNSDKIAFLIQNLPKLLMAYMAFKAVKAVAPGMLSFSSALTQLAGKGISGLAGKLFGVGNATKTVGKTSVSGSKQISAMGTSFLKVSLGISLIVGSLAGLALAIKPLAELGSTAVPALAAFGFVVGGLAAVFGVFGQSLQTNMKGIVAFSASVSILALAMTPLANTGKEGAIAMGTFGIVVGGLVAIFALFGSSLNAAIPAMLSFGATILMVGTGMSLASNFINALIPFVKQLGDTFTQVVGAISSAVFSILSSVGSLVSTISDAVSQIVNAIGNTLCNVMQTAGDVISQVVDSISEGFNKICEGVASVIDAISGGLANVLDSIAGIIESVGNSARNAGQGFKLVAEGIATIADLSILDIAKSLGAVATGIGTVSSQGKQLPEVASGVQTLISSLSGAASLAPGIQSMSASLAIMGAALPSVTANATTASASILVMATNGNVLSATLMNLISYITLFSAYLPNMSAGLIAFGAAITVSSAGALVLATALLAVNGSMKSISSNAKLAQTSLNSMVSSVNIVEAGLDGLQSMAESAIKSFVSAFKSGNKQATSEAKSMAKNITNSIQSGLNPLPQVARSAMSNFTNGLNQGGSAAISAARTISSNAVAALGSASGSAYSHGYNIGAGFANGMAASLGRVQAIASQMAAAAAQAIAAKAKIGSPSKVTYEQGQWMGEGLVNGLKSMIGRVWNASEDLVNVPNLAIAGMSGFQGELSSAYSYNRTITIIVPVDLDGREIARVTAPYMEEDLSKIQQRNNRLAGRA